MKKTIGRANLTYNELLTVTTEVEAVLNSIPLTYINADDLGETLNPSHLILGIRVLSLPDLSASSAHDLDYNQTPEVLNRRMRYDKSICHHFWVDGNRVPQRAAGIPPKMSTAEE